MVHYCRLFRLEHVARTSTVFKYLGENAVVNDPVRGYGAYPRTGFYDPLEVFMNGRLAIKDRFVVHRAIPEIADRGYCRGYVAVSWELARF
jgi:hypothetical protein